LFIFFKNFICYLPVLFIFGAGFAHAVIPLASSAYAREDMRSLRRAVRMGFWITGLVGVLSMPILWFFEDIYILLGQDIEVSALASDCVRVAQWGFSLLYGCWYYAIFMQPLNGLIWVA